MSRVIIATPVLIDAATVTASSAVAAGPVINLQRKQPADIWRAAVLTPYITVDLGSVSAFNLVALLFTNAQQTATWRIRTADSEVNLTAAPTYDSGVIDFSPWDVGPAVTRRHGFKWRSTGWTNRWLRIDLNDTGNPDGVFDAGRLYVANAYQPTRGILYGKTVGFDDTSSRDRTFAGNTIVNQQGIIPVADFELALCDKTEFYQNTHRIQQLCGGSRDVLVMLDPDDADFAHDMVYYGLMRATVRVAEVSYKLFTQRYEIEGLI